MKKLIFLFFIVPCYITTIAQPIYNAADYADIDSNYVLSKISAEDLFGNDFQGTGVGYSWDFSSLSIASQENIQFIDPNNSGYFESFLINCLAGGGGFSCYQQWLDISDLAQPSDESLVLRTLNFNNRVDFYTKENALVQTMIGFTFGNDGINIPLPVEFEIPDTIYKFPLNYQDSYETNSSYSLSLDASGYQVEYMNHKNRFTTVEGYGNINTPYMNFNNALKLKTIIEHGDTLIYNGSTIPLIQMDDIIFTWLHPNFGYPVFQVKGSVITGSSYLFTEATFIDTVRCLEPNAFFMSIPPSAYLDSTGNAEIYFFNLSANADNFVWDFGDNQNNSSSENSPSHTFTEAGVYEVKLVACNTICDPQVCDSISLQIEIIDTSTVSIVDSENKEMYIYPNPAKDYIYLKNLKIDYSNIDIKIYNIQGILRKENLIQCNNIEQKIDIKELSQGVYFIEISSENYKRMFKIIKF